MKRIVVKPVLSVAIVTWNSKDLLERCLARLKRAAAGVSFEVAIVDNGSREEAARWLEEGRAASLLDMPVKLKLNPRNLGVAKARNQAIELCSGEFICLLDDDTEPQPFSLERLVAILRQDPACGLVGPRLVHPDGSLQYSCRRLPSLPDKLGRRLPPWLARRWVEKAKASELRDWGHDELREVDYVIGACQVVRRSALVEVGPLDERIFYGPEDVDFCLRLWRKGWKVLYAPDSWVIHYERRLTRRLLSRLTFWHAAGLAYYFAKHRYLIHPPVLYGGRGAEEKVQRAARSVGGVSP